MKSLQKQLFIFFHLTRHIHLCKKIKSLIFQLKFNKLKCWESIKMHKFSIMQKIDMDQKHESVSKTAFYFFI